MNENFFKDRKSPPTSELMNGFDHQSFIGSKGIGATKPYINSNQKLNSDRAKLANNLSQKMLPYPMSTKNEE